MATYKPRTLLPLRVSRKLRADVQSVLVGGESLSDFITNALSRRVESRRMQSAFLARGLASAERSRTSGDYVAAKKVVAVLRGRLQHAT